MESVTLYRMENDDIKVDIIAVFEGDILVIDGYDIGRKVKEYWGDSDYEYSTRIFPEGVRTLYSHFGVIEGERQSLLEAIASRYNTNSCYSEFGRLLDDLKIKYEGSSWV